MDLLEDLFRIGDGVRSGIQDVPSFVANVLTGDIHGAVTDGRNIIGDVTDVVSGVQGLGVSLGEVPQRYLGDAARLADSKILAAAQLAIEAEKAMTGSGNPDEGNGYRESAAHLDGAVETLVDTKPSEDRWDGAAADSYEANNDSHRRNTSAVQVADAKIAEVLRIEAGQVIRTRETLDEVSQSLYDFGLATAWMNYVPALAAAKAAADTAAAAAALATTNATMAILVKNSAENALRIRDAQRHYSTAIATMLADDRLLEVESRDLVGPCGTLVTQSADLAHPPSRMTTDHYEVPELQEPEFGPPATPYGPTRTSSTEPNSSSPATAWTGAMPLNTPPGGRASPPRADPSVAADAAPIPAARHSADQPSDDAAAVMHGSGQAPVDPAVSSDHHVRKRD